MYERKEQSMQEMHQRQQQVRKERHLYARGRQERHLYALGRQERHYRVLLTEGGARCAVEQQDRCREKGTGDPRKWVYRGHKV